MKLAWNVKKNTAGSLKNLEREQNRDNVNNRNELIDKSRSHLNYELVPGSRNLTEKTLDLVEQSRANGSRIQKNSVVDLSNIITLSREYADKLGYEGTKYYFSSVVEYFQEEFGKENVTSAIVHLDESKPHMHLHITPINAENGKLQARNVMTRGRVNKIHTELPKFLQERGFDVERGNSREKDGTRKDYVRDINKLKQLTEQEREKFSAFKQKNDVLEKTLDKNKTEITEISKIRGHKEQEIISVSETLEKEKEALKKALNEKLEYEREMQKLFDQKLALSDEIDEMRGLVEDTKALAEAVNTYKDGGYKIPLAKFGWEERYRPLNVFEKDFNKLNDVAIADEMISNGRLEQVEFFSKFAIAPVEIKTREENVFRFKALFASSDTPKNLAKTKNLEEVISMEFEVEEFHNSQSIRDMKRYKRFKNSEFADEVKSTLEKNDELQNKFEKHVPAKKKQREDFER